MWTLVLYDAGYRRVQKECPGDSGEDADRGEVIVVEMRRSMRFADPQAFEEDENFWPRFVLVTCFG